MNKIQVKSKEQQVECKKVGDFTDTSFHNTGFSRFYKIGFSSVSVLR